MGHPEATSAVRAYIAMLMGFATHKPETWPAVDILDWLAAIERRQGHERLLYEIHKLTTFPWAT